MYGEFDLHLQEWARSSSPCSTGEDYMLSGIGTTQVGAINPRGPLAINPTTHISMLKGR